MATSLDYYVDMVEVRNSLPSPSEWAAVHQCGRAWKTADMIWQSIPDNVPLQADSIYSVLRRCVHKGLIEREGFNQTAQYRITDHGAKVMDLVVELAELAGIECSVQFN